MDESEADSKPRLSWADAFKEGNLEVCEEMLKENSEYASNPIEHMLPVMAAVRAKNHKLVRLLLQYGARATGLAAGQENHRSNSLLLAATIGDAESAEVLIDEGKLDPNGTPFFRPVLTAAHHHHLGVLKVLDKYGADLNVVNTGDNSNALIETSRWTSSPSIVEYLVTRGVACDVEDSRGMTPLMYLANLGDVESIKILVEKGGAKLDHRGRRNIGGKDPSQFAGHADDVLSLAEKRKMAEVVFYCWTQGLNPSNTSMPCHLGDINVTRISSVAEIGARNHFAFAAIGSKIYVYGGVANPYDLTIETTQAQAIRSSDYSSLPKVFKVALDEYISSRLQVEPKSSDGHEEDENAAPNANARRRDRGDEVRNGEVGADAAVQRGRDIAFILNLLGPNALEEDDAMEQLMLLARNDPELTAVMDRLINPEEEEEFLDEDNEDEEYDDYGMSEDEEFGADDPEAAGPAPKADRTAVSGDKAKAGSSESKKKDDEENADELDDSNVSDDAASDSSVESHDDYVSRYSANLRSSPSHDCFVADLDETTMEPIFANAKMYPKLKRNTLNLKKFGDYMAVDKDGLGGRAVTPPENSNFEPCLAFGVKSFNRQRGSFGYFEMHVIAPGLRRLLSIGLVGKTTPIKGRQPGWDAGTFGLHGDDGSLFCQEGSGTQFADRFEAGDVVGCGINWETSRVFFTVNGRFLGFAPVKAQLTRLYPCVAVRNPGAIYRVNFGAEPFRFDFRAPVLRWKRILPPTSLTNTLDPRDLDTWHENTKVLQVDSESKKTMRVGANRNAPNFTRSVFATEPNNQYMVLISLDPIPDALNSVYLFHLEKQSFILHNFRSGEPSLPHTLTHSQTQFCQITPRTMLFYRPRHNAAPPTLAFFDTVLLRWFDVSQSRPTLDNESSAVGSLTGTNSAQTSNLGTSQAIDFDDDTIPQAIPEYHAMWLEVLTTLDQSSAEKAKIHLAGTSLVWALPDSYIIVDPVTGMHSAQMYTHPTKSIPSVALATESSSVSVGDSAVVFGGWDGTEQRNDLAVFNAATGMWYTPPYTGNIPRARNSQGGAVAWTKSAYFGANASDLPSGKLWLNEAQPVFVSAFGWGGDRLVGDIDLISFSTNKSDSAFDSSFPNDMEIHLSSESESDMVNFEVAKSHRILLYCRSSKFKRILSGEEKDNSAYQLIDPSLESASSSSTVASSTVLLKLRVESIEAFKGMLHFFYTDEIVREASWLARNSRALARLVDVWAPELSPKLLERLLLPRSTQPNILGSQMLAGFSNDKFSDLCLDVHDSASGEHCSIPVHKLILTSRSPYFKALCLGGMAESNQKVISVDSAITPFKLVLEFIYSYEVPYDRIAEHIIDMFVLASRFQVSKLKSTLENLLIFNLVPENVCAILLVAYEQSAHELQNQCVAYLKEHFEEVKADEDWVNYESLVMPFLDSLSA